MVNLAVFKRALLVPEGKAEREIARLLALGGIKIDQFHFFQKRHFDFSGFVQNFLDGQARRADYSDIPAHRRKLGQRAEKNVTPGNQPKQDIGIQIRIPYIFAGMINIGNLRLEPAYYANILPINAYPYARKQIGVPPSLFTKPTCGSLKNREKCSTRPLMS